MATRSYMDDKGPERGLVYSAMYRVGSFLWGFVWSYLFPMFGSFFKLLSRFLVNNSSETSLSNSDAVYHRQGDHQIGSNGSVDTSVDECNGEKEDSIAREIFSSASSSKYEFLSGKRISGFLEEPKTMSFTFHEVPDGSGEVDNISCPIVDKEGSKQQVFQGPESEAEDSVQDKTEKPGEFIERSVIDEALKREEPEIFSTSEDFRRNQSDSEAGVTGETEDSASSSSVEEVSVTQEPQTFTKRDSSPREDTKIDQEVPSCKVSPDIELQKENPVPEEIVIKGVWHKEEPEALTRERILENEEEVAGTEIAYGWNHGHDEKEESVGSNDDFPRSSDKNYFVSSRTSSDGFQPESPLFTDEDDQDRESIYMRHEFSDYDDDYIEFQPRSQYSVSSDDEVWSEEDLHEVKDKNEEQVLVHEEAELETDHLDKSEEHVRQEKDSQPNSEVQNDYSDSHADFLYEHQDLIEQLKMELKNARTGGLPTIQEESETEELLRTPPPIVQELRPVKVEERKFEHKDCIDEIQKVYKSYLDKMRKLDVLNCQTMHALGLLQMKDPFQSHTSRKYSAPAIRSLLSHNLFSCKQVADVVDPLKKVVADLHRDFETAYVGQLCLSWEILHWQYCKAKVLQTIESQGSHHYYYHQVAGEFQHFQVLIHRFVENEPFQGPRVDNYVKIRCVLRDLLQVPVIKDDNVKDNGKREDGEAAITIQMLIEVIEQSMRVYWEFLRSDKDDPSAFIHHPDPVDFELLMDVKSNLQKKEKKLKDILRSGNCIVKKFQKHRDQEGTHILMMVAQVELRLVWRVLNMSKITTGQLIWCHVKLDKIKLCNRRVLIEPSFLLFPC